MALNPDKERVLPVGNLLTKRIVIDGMDCIRAYYLLMKNFKEKEKQINGQAFNVCGAKESVCEMGIFTDTLIKISGLKDVKKVIDQRVYRPIDIQVQVGDTTKLKTVVDWVPEIPLETTLTNLYNYWVKKLSMTL